MTATATAVEAKGADRTAHLLSDLLEPKNIITAICLMIGAGRFGWAGVGWAVICVVTSAVLPVLFIVRVVRREGGGWAQRHLSVIQLRLAVIPVILAMVAGGAALLAALGAPREMLALQGAMFATLATVYAITSTFEWKVSGHASVYSGAVAMAVVAFDPWWSLALAVVVPIAWARVRLNEHTVAQTAVGTVLGVVIAGTVFAVLR